MLHWLVLLVIAGVAYFFYQKHINDLARGDETPASTKTALGASCRSAKTAVSCKPTPVMTARSSPPINTAVAATPKDIQFLAASPVKTGVEMKATRENAKKRAATSVPLAPQNQAEVVQELGGNDPAQSQPNVETKTPPAVPPTSTPTTNMEQAMTASELQRHLIGAKTTTTPPASQVETNESQAPSADDSKQGEAPAPPPASAAAAAVEEAAPAPHELVEGTSTSKKKHKKHRAKNDASGSKKSSDSGLSSKKKDKKKKKKKKKSKIGSLLTSTSTAQSLSGKS